MKSVGRRTRTARLPQALPFTPHAPANELLAHDGTALLIGLCLEQQVRSEKAMIAPHVLRERLGWFDARRIAALPAARLDSLFRRPPALHRFPGMMAKRVRALCAAIAAKYHNDGAKLWADATAAEEVYRRLRELPGFGDYKAASGVRILGRYGLAGLPGWERYSRDEDLPWEFRDGEKLTHDQSG